MLVLCEGIALFAPSILQDEEKIASTPKRRRFVMSPAAMTPSVLQAPTVTALHELADIADSLSANSVVCVRGVITFESVGGPSKNGTLIKHFKIREGPTLVQVAVYGAENLKLSRAQDLTVC